MDGVYALTVRTSFAAAHRLREYEGNCERLHGHNWRVEVTVESRVLEDTVVEKLLEKAQITQKQCSYEEALARDNAAGGA